MRKKIYIVYPYYILTQPLYTNIAIILQIKADTYNIEWKYYFYHVLTKNEAKFEWE